MGIIGTSRALGTGIGIAQAALAKWDQYHRQGTGFKFPDRPERKARMRNLDTGDFQDFQYNPDEVEVSVAVEWAKLKPYGLSHGIKQYAGTGDLGLSFTVVVDEVVRRARADTATSSAGPSVEQRIAFLLSLCYPLEGRQTATTRPPKVSFVYGDAVAVTGFLNGVRLRIARFRADKTLLPMALVADVSFEEQLTRRLTSRAALARGLVRSFASPESSDSSALKSSQDSASSSAQG